MAPLSLEDIAILSMIFLCILVYVFFQDLGTTKKVINYKLGDYKTYKGPERRAYDRSRLE